MPFNAGTTTRPCVKLNGIIYPLKDGTRIRKTDITPFAAKIASGDPKYGDFTYSSRLIFRDFRAGMGLLNARADKPGRYWHSTLDMRFPYQVTLQPQTIATTGLSGLSVTKAGVIGSRYVAIQAASDGKIYGSTDGATWTNVATIAGSGAAYALINHTPTGGSETMFAFFRGTTNYAYSTDGSSWTTRTGPSNNISVAGVYDGHLIAIDANSIYSCDDPTAASPAWSTLVSGRPGGAVVGAVTYVDENGNEALFYATQNALWRLNYYAGSVTLIRPFETTVANSLLGHPLIVHNGALMIATHKGILRWTYSTQTWIGPQKDDGFETTFVTAPAPAALFSDGEYLYAAMGTWIAVYDDQGWHNFWTPRDSNGALTNDTPSLMIKNTLGASANMVRVIAFGVSRNAYFEVPKNTDNTLQLSTYIYTNSGELWTSWDDGGFAEIPKGAFELAVNYSLKDADNSIAVDYAIDDATGWTSLGTITGTSDLATITKTLSFGSGYGIAFQKIRFRFTLTRDSGTNTTTPVLNYAILKYIPQPDTKFSWNCTLDFSFEALADVGLTVDQARSNLDTARASKPLVDFQEWPPTSTTYKVKVANRPENEWEVNSVLESDVQLVVAEVV